MSHTDTILARYDALDQLLVAHGMPATSPWWRRLIERWYRSGKTQAVLRVGRRGGKSSTLCRLAVVELIWGDHKIPPGDVGVVAIVSADKSEAAARLTTITTILDILGYRYAPWGNQAIGIRLTGKRLGVRVYAATIKGVSGFTAIFVFLDELAKWKDEEAGVNPASDVIASIRPTIASQPNAKIALSSSPLGTLDAHHDAYAEGETELQIVDSAPTWVAHPALTEARTHILEPDSAKWQREYGAIPQQGNTRSLLSSVVLDRAIARWSEHVPDPVLYTYRSAMDPATRRNAYTYAATTMHPDGIRQVVAHRQWQGSPTRPVVVKEALRDIAKLNEPLGIQHTITDQFAPDLMRELSQGTGVYLHVENWSPALKAEAYEGLKTAINQDKLVLPPDPWVKQDLLDIVVKITRAGEIYDLVERGGRHADYAPVVAIALLRTKVRARFAETTQSLADRQKSDFLASRKKEAERRERFGLRPVTHRPR